ncbi:hypothetical protein Scep_009965 [Stephania cephalantha]|uniref:Uncharacterized protein n=1 Tax=Stephania cephalantha TaxID=152367 RepID=A0AAP0JUZ0_9MAGN
MNEKLKCRFSGESALFVEVLDFIILSLLSFRRRNSLNMSTNLIRKKFPQQ